MSKDFIVKDISLASFGRKEIAIAETEMPGLMALRNEFEGKISGVAKFGFFVRLNESGAEGIVPVRTLGTDFYYYDDRTNTLRGSETGLIIGLGQRATVRLKEVDPIAGGIAFDALNIDGEKIPNIQKKRSLRSIRRKVNRNKSGSLKRKKKAKRS